MQIAKLILYIAAFFVLWLGSGLIISAVKKLARKIQIPSFVFSFFVLGVLTSIPEMAVGINSLSERRPEVFVGSLLGGVIVMFLLVIPLLAVINKKVHVKKHMSSKNLLVTLGIICTPAIFALDKVITNTEGYILIVLYIALFYIIKTKKTAAQKLQRIHKIMKGERKNLRDSSILKLIIGIVIVFVSSRYIVTQTIAASEYYNVSVFAVSMIVLGFGANLPELTLAIRSVTSRSEDVALGDYLGSAAVNTMLFGVLTLINNGDVITEKNFLVTFLVIVFALGSFFVINQGKSMITRKEGFVLLGCYLAFVVYEFVVAT